MSDATAYVLLEDGAYFDGEACAADTHAVGEVVFTTGMSGYQESVSDPSFAGQLITFTYPHIGNYGVSRRAMESERIWARAAIMREACNREDAPEAERGWLDWLTDCEVPAISGVDTRALVRHIREAGAMRGGIFPRHVSEDEAQKLIAAEPSMSGLDLASVVTPNRVSVHGAGTGANDDMSVRGNGEESGAPSQAAAAGPLIAVLDTGIKSSIVRNLVERGARVALYPCSTSAEQLLADDPDAVFVANGPGDPAALGYVVDTVREIVGKRPVWGICLGHQLLCRALGLQTYKLPFGHRGANHPVKDLQTGRVEITSQNHGFAVLGPGGARTLDSDEPVRWDTDFGVAQLTHVNLYDRTVEGFELLDVPGGAVQYHPEAGPGPHDSLHLFDRFLERIAAS
ncbi:MAG TPA: glutamine-hydrolyzing carbamoyl-phosphate synthase small subunit [Solirubrobacteraceae bacterium]|jgi:carbamoyl-phosphate synthase small subunit|nr:glutamine-hydrolyzing carbamoyl-phosphate synthase small subunit [Solirubrobacteraceae bacterium]